jgi:hypothetical protein
MASRPKLSPTTPVEIPVELLIEDATQPRQKFDDEQQQGLNESVKAEGIHVPLEVLPVMEGKQQKWKIVKGARRYRAAKNALMQTVPCVLATVKTLRAIHRTQLLENTNRADLDPADFGVALYTEYFIDQILALAAEQSSDGESIIEGVFERCQKPVERMVALRDEMCRLAGVAMVQDYLGSGRVRVPMKAVLERVGLSRLSEQQTKKMLTPVRQIEPDVLELLIGSGASVRALTELGKLPGNEQRQVVEDAHRAAAIDDGNVGKALRDVLDAQPDMPATSGAGAQIGGFGSLGDLDGVDNGDENGDLAINPIAGAGSGGKGGNFEPDPSLAFLTGPSGNAQKLVTDRPAPARGKTPPAGHGTMDVDDFLQFTGALEAIITVLDRSGATALSETQKSEASALWGEIAERCAALGLTELV